MTDEIPPKPGRLEPFGWMSDEAWRKYVLEERDRATNPDVSVLPSSDPIGTSGSLGSLFPRSAALDGRAASQHDRVGSLAYSSAGDKDVRGSDQRLGVTDPGEHGPGWRYVMVLISARGSKIRELAGPDSLVGQAVSEDVYYLDPDQVSVDRPWESGQFRRPVLVDEQHPPASAGVLIALPPQHFYPTLTQKSDSSKVTENGDSLVARAVTGSPVFLNATMGPGIEIIGTIVPERVGPDGKRHPVSSWDAQWADQFAAERGLPCITTPGGPQTSQTVTRTASGQWIVDIPVNDRGEGGRYPLTGHGAFRSIETEYKEGMLLHPHQVAHALEAMKTAGATDEELRGVATAFDNTVEQSRRPTITVNPSSTHPDTYDVTAVTIRGQGAFSENDYGRYESQTIITSEGAFTGRVHDDRWEFDPEPTHPELVQGFIEETKTAYPDWTDTIDGLYQQARKPNAQQWAHRQRRGGRVPEGVMRQADKWAGQSIDWDYAQQEASRATAMGLASALAPVIEAGAEVTVVTDQGSFTIPPGSTGPRTRIDPRASGAPGIKPGQTRRRIGP